MVADPEVEFTVLHRGGLILPWPELELNLGLHHRLCQHSVLSSSDNSLQIALIGV